MGQTTIKQSSVNELHEKSSSRMPVSESKSFGELETTFTNALLHTIDDRELYHLICSSVEELLKAKTVHMADLLRIELDHLTK